MTRGPKHHPTALKVLNGTFDKNPNRRNHNEPQPAPGAPIKPKHLEGLAADKWDELCEILDDMGILATSDGDLLEVYCVTYAAYRKALVDVARTGTVLVTREKDGQTIEVKRNPFSVELHKYRGALLKMLPEMGLTASARSRITVTKKAVGDILGNIQKAGG